jgi:SAM-dependent methyltransferase
MGRAMNYDDYASGYAHTRNAVEWVSEPIINEVKLLPKGSSVLEIGCGTGNYIIELVNRVPDNNYSGFDISEEMLKVAKQINETIKFLIGNADKRFPYPDKMFELEFMIDVIHHIIKLDVSFKEAERTLKDYGVLLIVTDSFEDMKRRSLTKYFPEILEIEIDRYPAFEELNLFAQSNGFKLIETKQLQGTAELNDEFITKLKQKCSSAMRLMPDELHKKGIERVREAQKKGEGWHSYYTMLKYNK